MKVLLLLLELIFATTLTIVVVDSLVNVVGMVLVSAWASSCTLLLLGVEGPQTGVVPRVVN